VGLTKGLRIFAGEALSPISWSLSQLSFGERQGTPWTGHQSIAGPKDRI